MKKNIFLLLPFLAFSLQYCTQSSEVSEDEDVTIENDSTIISENIINEFQIITPIGEGFDNYYKILSNGDPEIVNQKYITTFFQNRDSVSTVINNLKIAEDLKKINMNFEDSIKVKDIKSILNSNLNGLLIFKFDITSSKKLKYELLGTKDISGSEIIPDFKNNKYYKRGKVLKLNGINEYSNFEKAPFVFYYKKTTLDLLNKLGNIEDKYLYFHYGYSNDPKGKPHPAILFTFKRGFEFDPSLTKTEYAVYNRNGTCCPPQY